MMSPMVKIDKCLGKNGDKRCPKRESCLRYTNGPRDKQEHYIKPPRRFEWCPHYWEKDKHE